MHKKYYTIFYLFFLAFLFSCTVAYASATDNPKINYHTGIDFRMPEGSLIRAVQGGIVERSKTQTDKDGNKIGYGNFIRIKNDNGVISEYAHMVEKSHLKAGDRVEKNDIIGGVGSTGTIAGNNLHYTERVKDKDGNEKTVKPDRRSAEHILNNFARQYFDQ